MASIQRYSITLKDGTEAKRYRVFYRDATGKNVGQVFERLRDAEDFRDTVGGQRVTGNLPDRKAGRQTLQQLWDEVHKAEEYAPATLALHNHVWPHLAKLANKPIGDITP